MSIESCLKQSNNRVSYCCLRSAEITKKRKCTQHDAMIQANDEWLNHEST